MDRVGREDREERHSTGGRRHDSSGDWRRAQLQPLETLDALAFRAADPPTRSAPAPATATTSCAQRQRTTQPAARASANAALGATRCNAN